LSNVTAKARVKLSTYEYEGIGDETTQISNALDNATKALGKIPEAIHVKSLNDLAILGKSVASVVNKVNLLLG
ncbi:MAG: hypothetical protein AT713_07305, partial [Caldivirga sp. JCHS_4]